MKIKMSILVFFILVFISFFNIAVNLEHRNKIVKEMSKGDRLKKTVEIENAAKKGVHDSRPLYGYSDILKIVNEDSGIKIIKFDKSEVNSNKLLVTIEGENREDALLLVKDTIYQMNNFLALKNISINGDSIIINAEFEMTYK